VKKIAPEDAAVGEACVVIIPMMTRIDEKGIY
jgi:hypothetical protein